MESGDFVRSEPVGQNDLAFVVFENRKLFGVRSAAVSGGMRIEEVVPDSVAFRAGLQRGDVLWWLNDTRISIPYDMDRAKENTRFNREFDIEVLRGGKSVSKLGVFHHDGNFISRGRAVRTLDLQQPLESVSRLLNALNEMGGILQTRMYVQCQLCREITSRAVVSAPPTTLDTVKAFAKPLATLIGCGAEYELIVDVTSRAQRILKVYQEVGNWMDQIQDLSSFLRDFPLGEPIVIDPATVTIIRGDTLECPSNGVNRQRIHIAYCTSVEPRGREVLEVILAMAREERCTLIAVPDGKDINGERHCHLLVVKQEQAKGRGLETLSGILEGYINLILVRKGGAHATDFGVSDGKSTRLILEALRKIDNLK